jgi:hypothetical protein
MSLAEKRAPPLYVQPLINPGKPVDIRTGGRCAGVVWSSDAEETSVKYIPLHEEDDVAIDLGDAE